MIDQITKKMNDIGNITQTNELETADRIVNVPLDLIEKNKSSKYSIKHAEEIADSMKLVGQLTPGIAVVTEEGKYKLLSGHTRYEALKINGSKTMQLVIKDYDTLINDKNEEVKELVLIDANKQREKTTLEKSEESARRVELLLALGHTKTEAREHVAKDLHISTKTVRRHEKINELPDNVKNDILDGKITSTRAIKNNKITSTSPENNNHSQLDKVDGVLKIIITKVTDRQALKMISTKLNEYIDNIEKVEKGD